MEIKASEYGMYLFNSMLQKKGSTSEHWESIREKAEPLVRELIRLNSEMKGGGYKLTGYVDEDGKEKLTDQQRIKIVQEKLWKVSTLDLKVGDKIWLIDEEPEMYIRENSPAPVDDITAKNVYVTLKDWEDYTQKLVKSKTYFVLRAPDDWNEKEELYSSDEYWLEQADKLGI